MLRTFWAICLLPAFLLAGFGVVARADDVPAASVAVGQSVVLATRDKDDEKLALSPKSKDLKGSVVIRESATSPKYTLQYTAPSSASGFTETIVYVAGSGRAHECGVRDDPIAWFGLGILTRGL